MSCPRSSTLAEVFAAAAVGLGSTLACAGHGGGGGHGGGAAHGGGVGHGGGAGHTLAAPAFHRGGFRGGVGYRSFYGYPGLYGLGWGLGFGYGLGYGYGYGYPYYPYGPTYPVYGALGYGPPPAVFPPACPVAGQEPAPTIPAGAVPGGPVRLTDSDVLLNIRVPPSAVVRINGEQTAQNGARREFVSSGLLPGRTYTFVVTARWAELNGQEVALEQRLHVQGGERRNVDFLTPPPRAD